MMAENVQVELVKLISDEAMEKAADIVKEQVKESGNKALASALASFGGKQIADAIGKKLEEMDFVGVMAEGWSLIKELKDAVVDAKPGAQAKFRLGKFGQEIELLPEITLSAAGMSTKPLPFKFTVHADMEAVELLVEGGNLVEASAAKGKLSGKLKYGDVDIPTGVPEKDFNLGKAKRFAAPGIKITGPKK
jgi:leucyl aminopeptidase (aminopeptidase T)